MTIRHYQLLTASLLMGFTFCGCRYQVMRRTQGPVWTTNWFKQLGQAKLNPSGSMLENGARIEAKDKNGSTALALAADYGHIETAKLVAGEGRRSHSRRSKR